MRKCIGVVALWGLVAAAAHAVPTIDGGVSGGEGWLHLTEAGYAGPVTGGGQAGSSDLVGETSTQNWWDEGPAIDLNRGMSDNRGDVINFHVAHDATFLYLAVTGPTVPFNAFDDGTLGQFDQFLDNDQGDLFIAIDAAGGAPAGSLSAAAGHDSWGVRAVDFLGWRPTHVIGVQYVNNGNGGTGWANLQQTGSHSELGAEGQNLNNGGFDWMATLGGGRGYDTFNGVAGEFEFRIPWLMLGISAGGPAPGQPLRFSMYTTQNLAGYDTYDSGPGLGNGGPHEQLGDNPGDPDTGGQFGPSDPGSFASSLPGSNPVADLSLSPSHDDGVDTIEEYLTYTPNIVPEPGTLALIGIGLTLMARRGLQRRSTVSGFARASPSGPSPLTG